MVEITPFLSKNQNPLYLQVYEHIREEIKKGVLPPESKLPSIRTLSKHLNISNNTVSLSYNLLIAEGYIESRPRSGMYVKKEIEDISPFPERKEIHFEEENKEQLKNFNYDFHYGTIDSSLFPFKTYSRIANEIYYEKQEELFKYGEPKGEPGFRQELHRYLTTSRGVKCRPEQIIVTSGTQHSLMLLSQLIDMENKCVGFEEPGYNGARVIFKNLKSQIIPIEVKTRGICIKGLYTEKPNLIYVTPSHQFPNGYIMPLQNRRRLLEWAKENDSWIIEDDYDSEFKYHGNPVQCIQGIDTNGKVIYLGTFSKSFLPSLRISYMVLPYSLLNIYHDVCDLYEQTVPRIHQWILEKFMRTEEWSKHITKMRSTYRKKHVAITTAIKEFFNMNQINILGKDSGLHILIEVEGKSEEELIHLASGVGVRVYPTTLYWQNPNDSTKGTVLLGFGALSEQEIKDGIYALSKVWM
ncbi:PLP-dependent aminotransferase family protein [Priestia filamentosa]|uniref:MocR-like pyridoxine biosynthesis transcription factor PdxR n=1 Tax=Priestia filamentosa TaxID=1402861 RepID=UPI0039833A53